MKKKEILVAALMMGATMTYAQDDSGPSFEQIENKNGREILPVAGDIAIQFDASPLLNFALDAVNIMDYNGSSTSSPGFTDGNGSVIVGKYFLTDTKAVRAKFQFQTNGGLGTANSKVTQYFDSNQEVFLDATPNANGDEYTQIEDVQKTKSHAVVLGGGLEFRRGYARLQGFYGGELLFMKGGTKTTTEYGTEFNLEGETNGYNASGDGFSGVNTRILEVENSSMGIGLRGFVGVDYFILPKISIGAEFGWGFGYESTAQTETLTEDWAILDGATTASSNESTTLGNKSAGFSWGTDAGASAISGAIPGFGSSAALNLTAHF
ncbi:MAG: hypothetical protein HRT71_21505 [Flavobacteriales bacterium]|nr:hypothetical protein [Flavobacteriales bacterium]